MPHISTLNLPPVQIQKVFHCLFNLTKMIMQIPLPQYHLMLSTVQDIFSLGFRWGLCLVFYFFNNKWLDYENYQTMCAVKV